MIHIFWWTAWREHIKNAKRNPAQAEGYSRAAAIAQMNYLCYSVLYWKSVTP